MTARTFIITASAMFALAAPAAQANLERMVPAKTQFAAHHKIVVKNHKVAAKHGTTKHKTSTGPLYIYFPGTPNQASSAPSQDDCVTTVNNCSNDQLCSIWGMNCDLIGTAATNDAPAVSTQIESSPSTDQSTPAPVDNSASNDAATNDANSPNCPSGGTWDEDHQYCV